MCRYGGEEFVAILPELATEEALVRAESLRHMVSEMRIYHRGEALREVTISIGVAVYPNNGDTLEQLLSLSDRALYEAKHLGRNRVVLAEHSAERFAPAQTQHPHVVAY